MTLEFADLREEVDEVSFRHPKLKPDQAFIVWFLQAYAGAPEDEALEALPGPSGEKGVDAVWIDHKLEQVFIVQGKYHKSIDRAQDGREAMVQAGIAHTLVGDLKEFKEFCEGLEPSAAIKLHQARDKLLKGQYRLQMCLASTGHTSREIEREAGRSVQKIKSKSGQPARSVIFTGERILALLFEWLDGASPPVPALDLPMSDEPMRRLDRVTGITLWMFWMKGKDVADMYGVSTVRIFHRNIRGYLGLGDNSINQAMLDTIADQPKSFIYLNNGVTIVCDSATREIDGTRDLLNVLNPQIINGQQTTRVLFEAGKGAKDVNVLVRVIQIPTSRYHDKESYDGLVGGIVEATNRQNAIKNTDLRSNDRVQVMLERELGKLGYRYVRKRAAVAETRALANQAKWTLRKEDVAKAAAACKEPGLPRLVGVDKLFKEGEPYYKQLFASESPRHYLIRWWLMKQVDLAAWGESDRQWAKYTVIYLLWHEFGDEISRHPTSFVAACENPRMFPDFHKHLDRLIALAFRAVLRYYQLNKGKGHERVEISVFFKRRDLYDGFEKYWKSGDNKARTPFELAGGRFVQEF